MTTITRTQQQEHDNCWLLVTTVLFVVGCWLLLTTMLSFEQPIATTNNQQQRRPKEQPLVTTNNKQLTRQPTPGFGQHNHQ